MINGEMGRDLARSLPDAGHLSSLAIDHAHHVGIHESFADAGGCANESIRPDAAGDVAAIAVAVFAHPDAPPNVADLLLDLLRLLRVEERRVIGCGRVALRKSGIRLRRSGV